MVKTLLPDFNNRDQIIDWLRTKPDIYLLEKFMDEAPYPVCQFALINARPGELPESFIMAMLKNRFHSEDIMESGAITDKVVYRLLRRAKATLLGSSSAASGEELLMRMHRFGHASREDMYEVAKEVLDEMDPSNAEALYRLLNLPIWFDLTSEDLHVICEKINYKPRNQALLKHPALRGEDLVRMAISEFQPEREPGKAFRDWFEAHEPEEHLLDHMFTHGGSGELDASILVLISDLPENWLGKVKPEHLTPLLQHEDREVRVKAQLLLHKVKKAETRERSSKSQRTAR